MTWNLRLIENPFKTEPAARYSVGDCWYEELEGQQKSVTRQISPTYKRDHEGKRLPICLVLPGGTLFNVDCMAWNELSVHGDGWTVTGDLPNITVTPSINIVGSYHGHIQNGVITDDCEGRIYKTVER